MSIHTHNMVDGVVVPLTPEQIAKHDAADAAYAAAAPGREQKRQRNEGLLNDPAVVDLTARIATATAGQIETWIAATSTTDVLAALIKLMAARSPARLD
jgi:hypothetical protein